MNQIHSIRKVFLALILSCAMLAADFLPVAAVTWSDVNALKSQANSLGSKKKELTSKLKELANDKSRALERKDLLDQKIDILGEQISVTERQISEYQSLIVKTQLELEDAQRKEEEQYDLFCQRVRAMEENGKVSYWSVLFKASDFTDMLSRMDFINEVMEYDRGVIAELQEVQTVISAKKADLETQLAEEKTAKAELVANRAELDAQRDEANALAQEIQESTNEYNASLDEIEKEEEDIQKKVVQLSRELAAKEAAANGGKPVNASLGGYIWPVSSRKINSYFGKRNTGIRGASKNHKGIDIGGVYYNTPVVAAKAGTVIVSQRSSSYGEYVVVSHGGGNTTLYAHMSSRAVSVGDTVKQGQRLGITGSTGISSGPHLHFEITENGNRINPLNYLK